MYRLMGLYINVCSLKQNRLIGCVTPDMESPSVLVYDASLTYHITQRLSRGKIPGKMPTRATVVQ